MWLTIFIVPIVLVMCVKLYQTLTLGICPSSAHMVGKVVVVTGANSGIGLETAKDLANRGARVILGCRSVARGEAAREEIVKHSGNEDVHVRQLDLATLKSVREFCNEILKTEKRLDVLINNAAAAGLGNYRTEDGLHIGMQVNYFAHFLLTCLLLPLLKSSAPSRIINVSSTVHKYAKMDFENLNMEKNWSDYYVYTNTKLYINLMTLQLSEKLKGSGVTVNCLHPGIAATGLFQNIPNALIRYIVSETVNFMFQTPWEAAQTSIFLAVAPDVSGVTGKYFSDCREKKPSKLSQDRATAHQLWLETEKLLKFSLDS